MANFLNYTFSKFVDNFSAAPLSTSKVIYHNTSQSFSFRFRTVFECINVLKSLNPRKAPVHSSVPAWALEDGKTQLHKPLTFLINRFIYEKRFPTDLKRPIVTPLFKKGSPEDPVN